MQITGRLAQSLGIRLQIATVVAIVAFIALLGSVYVVGSRRLEQSRVELLASVGESAVSLSFRQDATTFEGVDRAFDRIGGVRPAEAAA